MLYGNTGLQSLGVTAVNPPDMSISDHRPTDNDYTLYREKHLWFVDLATTPKTYEVYFLASKENYRALWLKIYPSAGSGGGYLRSDDLGIEEPNPATNAINVYGGEPYGGDTSYINMYTNKLDAYTLYVNLKRSICQPFTNATATEGMYSLGKINFLHAFGTNNTFLGLNGVEVPSVDPVNAKNNTTCGAAALHALVGGANCTAIGYNAAHSVSDGVYITAIGSGAGSALGPTDSSCILIGHPGVSSDTNLARIGVSGTGDGEIDSFYLGGVWNRLPTPAKDTGLVMIDEDEKLSTYNTEINSIIGTDASGNPIALKGDVGTFLVGHGLLPADPYPTFETFKLDDPVTPTVTWSTDPVTGQIILTAHAGGAAGITSVPTNAGIALPAAGVLSILGGELIETDAATPNTVTVNLTRGADRQIVVGNTGAASTYRTLLSSDGSIDVDFSNPAQVNLKLLGIPPVGGVNYLMDHALLHVPPISNGIQIEQGANITTVGDALNAKITVAVTDSVELPLGHLLTRDYIETTTGNLKADAGNLELPITDSTGAQGVIKFGGISMMHCRGAASTTNIFVGPYNSNFATLDTASSTYNSSLGRDNLKSLTTSAYNTALGGKVLDALTSGSGNNTSCGYASGSRLLTGAFNTYLGEFSGYNNTGSESHNLYIRNRGVALENRTIRIGTDGAVDGGQTACYIAAIYGQTPGATPQMVTIGSDGKLGTSGIPSGGASTFVADSGSATTSGVTINVKGGDNTHTTASGSTVKVHLDSSILQPYSATSSNSGVYAIGSTSYNNDRFLHAWTYNQTPPTNIYAGYQAGHIDVLANGFKNVGVGYQSLTAVTTAHTTTALGYKSGSLLTSGAYGTYLGALSGSVYTNESYNITLNHNGEVGDSRTMRLGFNTQWAVPTPTPHDPDPVETRTVRGVDNTYIYGIYRSTVDYSGTPVYVDKTGHLGTEGGVAFSFHQAVALSNVTGDGTYYKLGVSGGLLVDFDKTSSLTLGGAGAPIVFRAPYYGKYIFTVVCTYIIPAAPVPPPSPVPTCTYLLTSQKSYSYSAYIPNPLPAIQQKVSEIVNAIVYLDAGDTVQWAVRISNTTKTIGLSNYTLGPAGEQAYDTFCLGYRIS